MARKLAVALALLVVVNAILWPWAEAAEGKSIFDGILGKKISADTPPVNPYKRSCSPNVKCRGRRLLALTSPLPQVSNHGLQHHVAFRN